MVIRIWRKESKMLISMNDAMFIYLVEWWLSKNN